MDVCISGKNVLRRRVHNHDLPCNEKSGQSVIGTVQTQDQLRALLYVYLFVTSDDMPDPPGEFYTSSFYARGLRALCAVSTSASPEPAFSAGSHTIVVTNIENSAKDVF